MMPAKKEAKVYIDDITNGLENVKISYVNEINYIGIPDHISYITNCILGSESLTEDFESLPVPCNCDRHCFVNCSCNIGGNIAYNNGLLLESYITTVTTPIVECSYLCSCSKNCSNRVVQQGINMPLQLFMTEFKGIGVQTLEFIPKLTFVCEYAGEIIDLYEARKRSSMQLKGDSNYIYKLEECNTDSACIKTIIDPTNFGNVGRYLNHSCSPNLMPVPVRANNMLPRICFFAKEDILPLQELVYNYKVDQAPAKKDLNSKKKCYCKSVKCSGFLPHDIDWLN